MFYNSIYTDNQEIFEYVSGGIDRAKISSTPNYPMACPPFRNIWH